MRIYIIANDGITLCREPPATVNKGEVAVASREELHAARLSGKRLLALWNALPGVEKHTKVGDRDTLIDQLWSAIEALPDRINRPIQSARQSRVEVADLRPRIGLPGSWAPDDVDTLSPQIVGRLLHVVDFERNHAVSQMLGLWSRVDRDAFV